MCSLSLSLSLKSIYLITNLVTEKATILSDEGMAYLPRWDGVRLHHATQNYSQCKTYKLVISGISH